MNCGTWLGAIAKFYDAPVRANHAKRSYLKEVRKHMGQHFHSELLFLHFYTPNAASIISIDLRIHAHHAHQHMDTLLIIRSFPGCSTSSSLNSMVGCQHGGAQLFNNRGLFGKRLLFFLHSFFKINFE